MTCMQPLVQRTQYLIKAVLFDLDGVLINSYHAWFHLFNDALGHFGFPMITEAVFGKHWGQSTEEDVRIFMPGKTLHEVRHYFLNNFHRYIDRISMNPDAHSVLMKLKQRNLKLGCVTNSHRDIAEKIIVLHKLNKFFEIFITADDVEQPKPAPDMIIKACRQMGVEPAQTLFVGDTVTDLKAAKNAGTIAVGYKIDTKIRVDDLKDIHALVNPS
jgi:HAD superfamily hydrolase (TIGR01509 family)